MTEAKRSQQGFSLVELLIAMTIMLILMGLVSTLLGRAMSVRTRESQRTDALTSAQAALNVMSREISNAGFGINTGTNNRLANNGIVIADSSATRIRFRANLFNTGLQGVGGPTTLDTNEEGEDVTYFFDSASNSIVRYDSNDSPETSAIVNRISAVTFRYFDYTGTSSAGTETTGPTENTGRIRITVLVQLDPVAGQPNPLDVQFTSEVTLRNSNYMLNQY